MKRRRVSAGSLLLLAWVGVGCETIPSPQYPAVSGRRILAATVVAGSAVPYQVAAYELEFPPDTGVMSVRRVALLVQLFGVQGQAQGFTEWARPGEPPRVYTVAGWARQQRVQRELVTVFELSLDGLEWRDGRRAGRERDDPEPAAVRVVVNEASGEATLTRRR